MFYCNSIEEELINNKYIFFLPSSQKKKTKQNMNIFITRDLQ